MESKVSTEPKVMWGDGTPWKTKSQFYTYIRGCLRRAWMRHPCKINKIIKVRFKADRVDKHGNLVLDKKTGKPKQVWNCECEICGYKGPSSSFHVDHINPTGTLTCFEDLPGFVERLLYVTEDDLRLTCKECNYTLAYADKQGVTFEEAKAEKKAISLVQSGEDKVWLISKGLTPESTKIKRRKQIVDFLLDQKDQ